MCKREKCTQNQYYHNNATVKGIAQFLISFLKILKSIQNYWHRVTDITSFGKRLESSLGHTQNFLFGAISFQEYVSKGITHLVFYGDLVYKLRRVKGEANFISSGSKIVKRLRRHQYDPAIIERTIGLVLGPLQPCADHSLIFALWLIRRLGLYDGHCL